MTKQVIFHSVKDHLIPHISEKTTCKDMFDALVTLYQSENIHQKMLLWNKLRSTEVSKTNIVTTFSMKVIELHEKRSRVKS